MLLAILFHFLSAQHISDINISIIRSLRLFCWITTLVVLFLVRCVLEFRCWVGVDILMSETFWAHKKWNKIASDIKLVFYPSTSHFKFISYLVWIYFNIFNRGVLFKIYLLHGLVDERLEINKTSKIFLLLFLVGILKLIFFSGVYWIVHHCDNWRIQNQLDTTNYFIVLLMGSTCFGQY